MQDVNGRKRKEAPPQAPAAKRPAVAREAPQDEATWEDFAAQGDSALQCLGHKLSLKKRDTVTTVKELTLAYIKRLRALGWHLHFQCERCSHIADPGCMQSLCHCETGWLPSCPPRTDEIRLRGCYGMRRLQAETSTLESACKAETDARAADKAAFLDRLARLSAQLESLKVPSLPHLEYALGTHLMYTTKGTTHQAGNKIRCPSPGCPATLTPLLGVSKLMRWMCILQEELETAKEEGAESASARDALQSQLSRAMAAEDSLKAKCQNLEAQAACTAGQLQEMQQQVRKPAPMALQP